MGNGFGGVKDGAETAGGIETLLKLKQNNTFTMLGNIIYYLKLDTRRSLKINTKYKKILDKK